MAWLPPGQVYGPPIPPNTPMNPDGTYGDVPTAADFFAGIVSAPPPRPPDDVRPEYAEAALPHRRRVLGRPRATLQVLPRLHFRGGARRRRISGQSWEGGIRPTLHPRGALGCVSTLIKSKLLTSSRASPGAQARTWCRARPDSPGARRPPAPPRHHRTVSRSECSARTRAPGPPI